MVKSRDISNYSAMIIVTTQQSENVVKSQDLLVYQEINIMVIGGV